MGYESAHLSAAIQKARVRMGLSQRDLCTKSGVSQAQISKFENGAIDLRLSSLVALFRAVELELELVPRACLPAVQSIVRSTTSRAAINPKLFTKAKFALDSVLQELVKSEQWPRESERLREHMDFLERARIPAAQTKNFKRWIKHLEDSQKTPLDFEKIKNSCAERKSFENKLNARSPMKASP